MIEIRKNENKWLRLFLLAIALTVVFTPIKCLAKEYDTDIESEDIDEILEDFYGIIPNGIEIRVEGEDISEELGVKRIFADVIGAIKDNSGELATLLSLILGIGLFVLLGLLCDTEMTAGVVRAVGIVGAALMLDRLCFLVDKTVSSLSQINDFFASIIPITLVVNSIGASPTTASTQAIGMGLTLGAYSIACEHMLGGVVGAIFVSSALSGIDPLLSQLARTIKGVFTGVLGVLTVLIGATFALQSSIAVSTDSMAIRSARYAVSSAIPIVGNAVSGALGLISGSISYARTIIGGGAIAVVITLVLSPLVTLLAYRLCIRLGIGFCSLCSIDAATSLLSSFLYALDALIATYSLTSVLYIVELVAFLKGGVSIA